MSSDGEIDTTHKDTAMPPWQQQAWDKYVTPDMVFAVFAELTDDNVGKFIQGMRVSAFGSAKRAYAVRGVMGDWFDACITPECQERAEKLWEENNGS